MRHAVVILFTVLCGANFAVAAPQPDGSCLRFTQTMVRVDGVGVLELLKDVPITATWAELPELVKQRLQVLADERLAEYRANWSADALERKLSMLLRCPTPTMTANLLRYPLTSFLQEVKSRALADALVRVYLGAMAAERSALHYVDGRLTHDWDGGPPFDSVRLPDRQTYEDIKAFNRTTVADLRTIDDASLMEIELLLKQFALTAAYSYAAGSDGSGFGSDSMEQACNIVWLNSEILAGYELEHGRPPMFANDEAVLREANAIYLHNTRLKWFDVGTRQAALTYCAPPRSKIEQAIGDPGTNSVARIMILLQKWWEERIKSLPAAKCTVYSAEDRAHLWEAFSADMKLGDDSSSSLATTEDLLRQYKTDALARYRDAARTALKAVFPDDTLLTRGERAAVSAALDARTDFGLFVQLMPDVLDAAQKARGGSAARAWRQAVAANMETIGGGYAKGQAVRPDDLHAVESMFAEVKSWIGQEYSGYSISIRKLFEHIALEVNTGPHAFAEGGTTKVLIGVGSKRSKAVYYGMLLHELRHAVAFALSAASKSQSVDDTGWSVEGSAFAATRLLLQPFLQATLKNDTAVALYALDFAAMDARFLATTDATLRKYFRPDCDGEASPDAVEFAKEIVRKYDTTYEVADSVAERVHAGTQYLQYIWGGQRMLDDIAYLQTQIDPSGKRRVDPFVLFACEANNPTRDKDYIDDLKICMEK